MLTNSRSYIVGLCAAFIMSGAAVPNLYAATVKVTADTPVSFRATFTGVDTDPLTVGGGNDFQQFTFDFWSVLVNLRGDSVDGFGNAAGFYEIQLKHTGTLAPDPTAPVVNTFLFYGGLQPGVTLTDTSIASQPHGAGAEFLSTTVNITFDPANGRVLFSGSIAGESDLDGDGDLDSTDKEDVVVKTLKGLKNARVITGREMGQIIKQTNQPTTSNKPDKPNK